MRVLHIDTGREMQGGQWQVLYLAERLAGSAIDARPGSPLEAEAQKRGLIAADPFDNLIHAHDARAHTKCILTAKLPFVVSRRVGFQVGQFFFSRLKYRYAARYLAVSNFVADQLRTAGVPGEKIRVVYDGIPIPSTSATPQPGRVIAVASKSQELSGIPVHLTQNLFDDLKAASVFLYVSQMEGLGSAAIAAMASGVPVVASAVGGLPEVVEHERTGLLVRDGDYAGAVRRLLENPTLAAEMGAAGREKAIRQFSVEKMVESTLSAYNEILR